MCAYIHSASSCYFAIEHSLMQIKTVLSAEPHGKQAEKRKKEVMELETKVWLLLNTNI